MDPKYQGLPGIAADQPDYYETNDLPESDQHSYAPETFDSDAIDRGGVDPNAAAQNYRDRAISAEGVDFSDSIGYHRRNGYRTKKFAYEVGTDLGEPETPEQRYARLKIELQELAQQVNNLKKEASSEAAGDKLAGSVSAKEVAELQGQLKQLQLEQIIGPGVKIDQSAVFKNLSDRLQLAKQKPGKEKLPEGQSVTYELFYSPEVGAKGDSSSKFTGIEARLAKMETLVGQDVSKLAALTSGCEQHSLTDALQSLTQKVSMLDGQNLDLVEARLTAVLQKLNLIKEKRQQIDGENVDKINELYEAVKKWDSFCESLPQLLTRMQALKHLHEQAIQFSQALTQLDTVQQQISKTLETDTALLDEIRSGLMQNMETMKNNCEAIDKRMKALGK